ncbi:MAG: hypothetical protein ACPG4Z_04440, partial [Chitinophagales bacterium]
MKLKQIAIVILSLLLIDGLVYTFIHYPTAHFENATEKANNYITHFETDFAKLSVDDLKKEQGFPYSLFVYQKDSLIYWNDNKVNPIHFKEEIAEDGSFIENKNGYFLAFKKQVDDVEFIALHLFKTNYPVENKYLKNSFVAPFSFSENTLLEKEDIYNKSQLIQTTSGKELVKIYYSPEQDNHIYTSALVMGIIALLSFIFLIVFFLEYIRKQWSSIYSLGCSLIILFNVKYLLPNIPFEFFKTILFSPQLYASSNFGESLGMLGINAIFFLLFCFYAYQTVSTTNVKNKNWILSLIAGLITTSTFVFALSIIRSLIVDSTISFNTDNFLDLNIYTFLSLIIIVIVLFSLYFIQLATTHFFKKTKYQFVLYALVVVGSMLWLWKLDFKILSFVLPLVSLSFFVFFYAAKQYKKIISPYAAFIIVVICAAIQGSIIVEYYNNQKNEREIVNIASQLSQQRDVVAEYSFDEIADKISNDSYVKNFFSNPMVSTKDLNQRINYLYFSGYMSKFDLTISPFSPKGNLLRSQDSILLKNFEHDITNHSETTFSNTLHFFSRKNGSFSYLSILTIQEDSIQLGHLVLDFAEKKYQANNAYLDILAEGYNTSNDANNSPYDYAIYTNNRLKIQSGDYPYSYEFSLDNESTLEKNGYLHTIYKQDDIATIVVSQPKKSILLLLSTFSYLMIMLVVIGLLVLLFFHVFFPKQHEFVAFFFAPSFRNRINFTLILMIIGSFSIIGFITLRYSSSEYKQFHEQRLITKQKVVLSAIELLLQEKNSKDVLDKFPLTPVLSSEIVALSDINDIDINIYDTEGSLLLSSQSKIFSSGLLSRKMHPNAFHILSENQAERISQEEQIGNLSHLAVYTPIRNIEGEIIAYLNLPYFDKEKDIRSHLSNFVTALINTYTLLLLIASVLALLVSNTITRPLATIREKLRLLNLEKKNKAIDWDSDDDIGELVKEYNRMIVQIEQSAKLLARSERESAWREMAKQIAHEIKNPLTPMK